MNKLFLACFSCLFFFTSEAQDFQNTLQKFSGKFIPERIHIHFDKTSYVAGDTVWFKAYVLEGIAPTGKSKTLYVDWTDKDGKLVSRTSSPIASGTTFGQITLPGDYNSNFIHVKAYTRWMLNFDSTLLYRKDIRILSAKNEHPQKEKRRYLFNLFPESGNLVEGLNNKIAFKATDQYGRPAKISGNVIVNGKASEKINVLHDGMGVFFVKPEAGNKYSVKWTDSLGGAHTTDFPTILSRGVILRVGQSGKNEKVFTVESNDPNITSVHIIGTMYLQPVFDITRTLVAGKTEGLIPVTALPSGVMAITVLDQNYHPIAERITFINNNEYHFESDMEVEHWGLNKRARDEISISIPENMMANLSVSVTDNAIDFDSSQNIFTDLLLNSELKGKIFNPAFYFTGDNDSTGQMLDLVMLTNGWRKIAWQELAQGKLPEIKFPADTSYQTISGKLYGATASQLMNAGDIIMIVNQKNNNEWLTAPVNRDGTFKVNNFMLFDTATVYTQPPKNNHLQNASVQFMQNRLPVQPTEKAGVGDFVADNDTAAISRHLTLSEAMQEQLKFFSGKVLEDITITAKPKSKLDKLDETYTSGLFSGGVGTSFDIRDDPSASAYQNILQYLQGRVAGVQITMGNPPSITWRGATPTIFLDEMQVDPDFITTIPVTDIAYVKVLNPPFIGAPGGGAGGAIAIYTRKGGDVQNDPGKGLAQNKVTGYSVIRQFYSPDYDRIQDDKKDLRTTLYWNPEVILTPQNRKVTLKFFNNDVAEAFRVVIEGVSSDGRMTRLVQIME